MKTKWKRLLALGMCLGLCAGLCPRAAAKGETVTISTERELLALAERCVLDSYSRDLTVVLTGDIRLSGAGFTPIPVFCGVFEGGGHTITGFRFNGKGSDQGFFRYLKPGAVVRELHLADAELSPEGSKSGLGLLCGQNEGAILGCTVSGTVKGDADVGGLVGINLEGGTVENCVNAAKVTGLTHTGGLVGRNEGDVAGCTNRGEVNIEASESAQDTGGIAGQSSGSLSGCVNFGSVGYRHTGYNTGGIAGRQDGNVVGCENHAEILGRKDVGGIVGQFEPSTTLAYGEDPMQKLDDELSKLSGLMTRFADQINDTSGNAVNDLRVVNDAMDAIRGTTNAALGDGRDDAETALQKVYDSVQTINSALGTLTDHVDRFAADANGDIDEIISALDDMRETLDKGLDAVDGDLYNIRGSLNVDAAALENTAADIAKQIKSVGDGVDTVSSFVSALVGVLGGDGDVLDKLEGLRQTAADYHDRLESIDLDANIRAIGAAVDSLGQILTNLRHDLDTELDELSDDANDMWNKVNAAADRLSDAAGQLSGACKRFSDSSTGEVRTVNTAVDEIEDVLKAYLDAAGGKGGAAVNDVDRQLQVILDQMGSLADGASASSGALHDTTGDIIDELDAIRQAISDLGETPEKSVDDISDSVEQEGEKGRVISCVNTGAVGGDANVGGVAGIVSPELSLDPEEDLDIEGDKVLVDTTAYIKATIRDCQSSGAVAAKNDCAGGIVGRAEVGAVLDSLSTGTVETTSGNQCGGVAGLSRTTIRRCYSLSALTGNDKVGGIAGEGHDIRDCRSMVSIRSEGERLGAIAGAADGEVKDCYFARESLAGIDGVDYEGRAVPLDYQELVALPGLPEAFLGFTVTFVAEGRTVAALRVPYGGGLDPAMIPKAPEKDGLYGSWEEFSAVNVTRSRTVEAVYSEYLTAVATGEEPPLLLAEGTFAPGSTLEVDAWDCGGLVLPKGFEAAAGYRYTLGGTDAAPSGPIALRLRWEDDGEAEIAVLRDGALCPAQAVREGSYLCFPVDGAEGNFVLLIKPSSMPGGTVPLICAAAAALAAVAVLAGRGKKGREKKEKATVGKP